MKMYTATVPNSALRTESKTSYYARQKKLFVLAVIAISLTPLLVISWTSSLFYRQSWQKQASRSLASLASSRKEVVELFLRSQEDLLASLVELHSKEELGSQDGLERVFAAVNRSQVIADMGVIDGRGRHLSFVGPFREKLLGKNYSGSEWFRAVMKSGRYVSDVFQGFRGVPHFVVAVAAPDRSWALRATVNSALFNALLASAEVGAGGDAFIVSIKGSLQTPSRRGLSVLPAHELEAILKAEENGVHCEPDSLYAATWLKNGSWLLALKIDVATSLAEFHRARNRDFLIMACAGLTVLLVAMLLVGTMVGQLEKADSQRMHMMNRIRQAEKMALIGRLAASVAHEINNPLQIIGDQGGWMEELLEEAQPHDADLAECRKAAAKIRQQVRRAAAITHRLLGFSRKESGLGPTDVNGLVEESIAFLENEAKKCRIRIDRNLDSSIAPLISDASQLQQVFLNILNNAIDAVGKDGSVSVTTRRTGDSIVVEFADTGPGLSAAALGRIFDPFYTTKDKGKGTGLGLSISSSIMQRLGGDLAASSQPGGGCVFAVVIPAASAADKTAAGGRTKALDSITS